MKTFLIDPEGLSISPFNWDTNIATLQTVLAVPALDFVRINAENDRVALNDRGKIDGYVHGHFTITGYPQPLAGRACIFGVDERGEDRDVTVTLEWLKENVTFLGLFLSGVDRVVQEHAVGVSIRAHPSQELNDETLRSIDWTLRRCEEASIFSTKMYLPCGIPAVALLKTRDPRPYFMCQGCADHNLKNRGPVQVLARSVKAAI